MSIFIPMAMLAVLWLPAVAASAAPTSALAEVRVDRLDEVLAKPGVDWQQYTRVLLAPLDLSEVTIAAPAATPKRDVKPLTAAQQQAIGESYSRAFSRELVEDELFVAVDTAQPGTLTIKAKLLAWAPTYLPSERLEASGRNRVYTETAGKLTLQVEIYDATSGELLARVTDERAATRMWRQNNSVQNRAQINQVMGAWARIFRTHLGDVTGR
jgi:hypothetical protein